MSAGSALVVGAGVVGLSAAARLLEAGWQVRVLTADEPEATTSAVAAAIWYPYRAAPRERVLGWAARSMDVLAGLAGDPGTGVRLLPCREVVAAGAPDPWWREAVPAFRRCAPDEVPAGAAAAWELTVPVVAMPRYLPWLRARVEAAGGSLVRRRLDHLDEVRGEADVVVHCAGLGARDLVGDDTLEAVRGQVVVVEDPGLAHALLDDTDPDRPVYVVPRGRDCVLGGTADVAQEGREPDPVVAAEIVRRCTALEPGLAGARILAHRVGLRPVRPSVRLEVEVRGGTSVVHCYGHGGAGVTLSWGCAEEVAALAGGALAATP